MATLEAENNKPSFFRRIFNWTRHHPWKAFFFSLASTAVGASILFVPIGGFALIPLVLKASVFLGIETGLGFGMRAETKHEKQLKIPANKPPTMSNWVRLAKRVKVYVENTALFNKLTKLFKSNSDHKDIKRSLSVSASPSPTHSAAKLPRTKSLPVLPRDSLEHDEPQTTPNNDPSFIKDREALLGIDDDDTEATHPKPFRLSDESVSDTTDVGTSLRWSSNNPYSSDEGNTDGDSDEEYFSDPPPVSPDPYEKTHGACSFTFAPPHTPFVYSSTGLSEYGSETDDASAQVPSGDETWKNKFPTGAGAYAGGDDAHIIYQQKPTGHTHKGPHNQTPACTGSAQKFQF